MCNIILPLLILIKTNEVVEEENREKEYITKNNNTLWYIGSTIVLVVLFLFISGVLPIGMTAIASDSMHPAFDKGAAVITLKVKQNDLKKGDIISFYRDDKVIIHRIDSIVEEDGEIRYITKGDANNVADDGYILYDQIKNKIVLSIPLIGYPALIVGEVFNR
jgi:signal peptidase